MKKTPDKKITIAKMPRPIKFDLSMQKTSENTKILVALESLRHNQGWQFLQQLFTENMKVLSEQIINKYDEDKKPLSDVEIDEIRMRYSYLKEISQKPDKFIEALTRTDPPEEDLDPYER